MKQTLSIILFSLMLRAADCRADEPLPFAVSEEPIVFEEPKGTDAKSQTIRRTQWWMFTATWCGPCQIALNDFGPWLRNSGWIVDETPAAHIRILDEHDQSELVRQMGIRSYPTFVLMQDGREVLRKTGYPGRDELVKHYQAAVSIPQPVQAISVGTLRHQKENLAQWIRVMQPLLGNEGRLTLRLERTGNPPAILPISERITLRTESPLVMIYTLKNDVLTCRFAEPYPRGRLSWGLPLEQSVSAITCSVSEVVIELPHAPDIRLRVED